MKFQQIEDIKKDLDKHDLLYSDFTLQSDHDDRLVYTRSDSWAKRTIIIEISTLKSELTAKPIDLLDGNKASEILYAVYDCECLIKLIKFDKKDYNLK